MRKTIWMLAACLLTVSPFNYAQAGGRMSGRFALFTEGRAQAATASTAAPAAQQKKKPSGFIAWLKSIAGIRKPLVLFYPAGKVVPEGSLKFEWGVQEAVKADSFIIKVTRKTGAGAAAAEVWRSPSIPGSSRSFVKAPGLDAAPDGTYSWQLEAYKEGEQTSFIRVDQSFKFLSQTQLAEIREREKPLLQWLDRRPVEKHLLLLAGTFYAAEEMYPQARAMYARFLELSPDAPLSYKELTTLLARRLEEIEKERAPLLNKISLPGEKQARLDALVELSRLSLLLLDYEGALSSVEMLIAASEDQPAKEKWAARKSELIEEQRVARAVLPAETALLSTGGAVKARSNSPAAKRGAAGSRRVRRPADVWTATFAPAAQSAWPSIWFEVGDEFKREQPFPDVRYDLPSYYLGTEASGMIRGLWLGDIRKGLEAGVGRTLLQNAVIGVSIRLRSLKANYLAGNQRTPTLDEAWEKIPNDKAGPRELLTGFNEFARIVYPDPEGLDDPAVSRRRDELVTSLARLWKQPTSETKNERMLIERQFYDLLLWRTAPVFQLRITNGRRTAIEIDTVELDSEHFKPLAEEMPAAPPHPDASITFRLKGGCARSVTQPVSLKLAPGRSKEILVRIESSRKGVYRLHLRLKSRGGIVKDIPPFNLFYI